MLRPVLIYGFVLLRAWTMSWQQAISMATEGLPNPPHSPIYAICSDHQKKLDFANLAPHSPLTVTVAFLQWAVYDWSFHPVNLDEGGFLRKFRITSHHFCSTYM